jgi:hypothetical protein
MAVRTALCNSYKLEVLRGVHRDTDLYKIALIKNLAVGEFDQRIANYSELGADEVSDGAGYAAGGLVLAGGVWNLDGDTAFIDWNDPVWTAASIAADGAVIYNASRDNRTVMTISFADTGPVPVVSTNSHFIVQIPSGGTGQVRWT